jgi:hypothetical protein
MPASARPFSHPRPLRFPGHHSQHPVDRMEDESIRVLEEAGKRTFAYSPASSRSLFGSATTRRQPQVGRASTRRCGAGGVDVDRPDAGGWNWERLTAGTSATWLTANRRSVVRGLQVPRPSLCPPLGHVFRSFAATPGHGPCEPRRIPFSSVSRPSKRARSCARSPGLRTSEAPTLPRSNPNSWLGCATTIASAGLRFW